MDKEETIGRRVKKRRELQGWSLKYLADISGVPKDILKALEDRSQWPGQDALKRIAAALGVEFEWLLAGDRVIENVLQQKIHQLMQRQGISPEQEAELFSQILPRIRRRATEVATADDWITEIEKLVSESLGFFNSSSDGQLAKANGYSDICLRCLRCRAPYSGGIKCSNCGMPEGGYGPDQ